ncbi:AAA family ATPase [Naumannella sp. ID2617S]|nr:AAA family ATPase [Naumannella sp. ID2617S]
MGQTRAIVGREEELAWLRRTLALDTADSSVAVLLSGDAGIGKTRLLNELAPLAERAGLMVLLGRCVSQGGSELPYLPIAEVLSAVAAAAPDTLAEVRQQHPRVADLFAASEAPGEPARLAEGVHALLTRLGAERPILVVLEDLHWADDSSRDLITLLLTRGFSTPVSLVLSYRRDDLHRRHPLRTTLAHWSRLTQRLDLGPLPDDAVRSVVAGLAGGISADRLDSLVVRAEGNAFYAEELAMAASLGDALPDDLARVLRVRVDQVDEAAQRLIRLVAVGGREVAHELLARVSGLGHDALDAALRQVVEHHLLEPTANGYAFRHALLAETEYEDLLPGERQRAHRRYADAMREHPELGAPATLARHAAASGDLPTAISAGMRAGEEAMAVGAPPEAQRHFERVLGLMTEDDPQRDWATLRAATAASQAGNPNRAVQLRLERLRDPTARTSARDRAHLMADLVMDARATEQEVDILAMTTEAMGLLGPERDQLRLWVERSHVQALIDHGRYAEAARLGDEATALAEELCLPREASEIKTILVRAIEESGSAEDRRRYLAELTAELDGSDVPAQIRAWHQLASQDLREGQLERAREHFDRGAAAARRLGRSWAPWGLESAILGALVSMELGRWREAEERVDLAGDPPPQPARSLLEAVPFGLRVARGEGTPTELSRLRQWWDDESLLVVLTAQPGIELFARLGDLDAGVNLFLDATETLKRQWGGHSLVVIRLSAVLLAAIGAEVGRRSQAERVELLARVERLRRFVETAATSSNRADRNPLHRLGPEALAWLERARAEALRARWLAGEQIAADELVDGWRRALAGFVGYGSVPETARCRVRLAEALRAAGRAEEADAEAARARAVAERLGVRPLLDELGEQPRTEVLTPREAEILALVAEGRTNGEIGKRLFIATKTVSVHVSNLLGKLGAANRQEAVAIARRRGLLN